MFASLVVAICAISAVSCSTDAAADTEMLLHFILEREETTGRQYVLHNGNMIIEELNLGEKNKVLLLLVDDDASVCPLEGKVCFPPTYSPIHVPGRHTVSMIVETAGPTTVALSPKREEFIACVPETRPWVIMPTGAVSPMTFDMTADVDILVQTCARNGRGETTQVTLDGVEIAIETEITGVCLKRVAEEDSLEVGRHTTRLEAGEHQVAVFCDGRQEAVQNFTVGETPARYTCTKRLPRVESFKQARSVFHVPASISGDNPDRSYEQLFELGTLLAQANPPVPGASVEVGVRRGMGSIALMAASLAACVLRPHFGIDPFGNLEVHRCEFAVSHRPAYTNSMRRQTLRDLHGWADAVGVHLDILSIESTEFMARFADGVPFYQDGRRQLMEQYALVYIDGDHYLDGIMNETRFFAPRVPVGGFIAFDDATEHVQGSVISAVDPTKRFGCYDHGIIHEWLLQEGFEEVKMKSAGIDSDKRCYRRVRVGKSSRQLS